MINFFTGRPRNGKSLHMAMIIYKEMKKGKNVIANFEINEHVFDKFDKKYPGKRGTFIYVSNKELLNNAYLPYTEKGRQIPPPKDRYSYLEGLYGYANQFHKRNYRGQIIEDQTLLVLDECQELFNSRSWNRSDRLEWCSFFRQHGKYGYDVYLISQDDKVIDKQIRSILQYEWEHRYVKRMYGIKGKESKIQSKFFQGQQRYYTFYDSYKTFTRDTSE